MSKEPGELAYQTYTVVQHVFQLPEWHTLDAATKLRWDSVESAIRADEREKVIEIVKTRHSVFYDNPEIQFRQIIASITALGAEHG